MAQMFTIEWPAREHTRVRQTLVSHLEIPKDMRPVWKRFAVTMRTRHRITFDTMTDPFTGKPWSPLLPEYAEKKPPGTRNKILYRTGALRKSLTKAKSPGSVFVSQKQSMEFGTAIPYSVVHQRTGRKREDGTDLNRPHVGLKIDEDFRVLADMIRTEIISSVVRAQRKAG